MYMMNHLQKFMQALKLSGEFRNTLCKIGSYRIKVTHKPKQGTQQYRRKVKKKNLGVCGYMQLDLGDDRTVCCRN